MAEVKVVILNWNGKRHLERFLPSVVATVPAGIEVVVADNGSDDGSCEYLEGAFPSVRVLKLDRNYGFAGGYNRALEQLSGDYHVLLNSDVETSPGWCEPLIEMLESDGGIAAVSPKILSWSDRSKFEYAGAAGGFIDWLGYPFCRGRIMSRTETDNGQYDDARGVFWTSGACMMVRAEVYRKAGGLDEEFFAHMEEIDFCWRAQLLGYRLCVEPKSRVYHLGGGTLSDTSDRKIYLNFRNNLAMLYKNLPRGRVGAVVFLRMVLDAFSAMVYLVQGKYRFFRAVLRAHRDFRKWRPELKIKREGIRTGSVATPRYIYRRSILLRYFFGRKTFGKLM